MKCLGSSFNATRAALSLGLVTVILAGSTFCAEAAPKRPNSNASKHHLLQQQKKKSAAHLLQQAQKKKQNEATATKPKLLTQP